MENNTTPQDPKPTQVMDIQPPQHPVQQSPAAQVAVEPAGAQNSFDQVTETPEEHREAPVLAAKPPKERTHRTPVLAIACAVVIAGVFAGFAFMTYSSQPNGAQPETAVISEQPSVTPAEVEQTDKAIDESTASLDEAADYNDAAINDTTLGL